MDGRLDEAFRSILNTVQARDFLRHEPTGVKGAGWHALEVRLQRARGRVTVRPGYVRATPQ